MTNAILSADIVASTAMQGVQLAYLQKVIKRFLEDMADRANEKNDLLFWGRLVKGDTIECYIKNPEEALRYALLLKMLILKTDFAAEGDKAHLFSTYGVRVSIGVGEMRIVNRKLNVLDGEAIYLAGRRLEHQQTSGKERTVIKNTLFFSYADEKIEQDMTMMLAFIDVLMKRLSLRQSEVLYYKLLNYQDKEIAEMLHISQSAINQHCNAAGWNAIREALNYYENYLFN